MPCECPSAGMCPRYGVAMPPALHRLCQARDDYRRLFERRYLGEERSEGREVRIESSSLSQHLGTQSASHTRRSRTLSPHSFPLFPRSTLRHLFPSDPHTPRIRKWAVGMTTAPRKHSTIARSLASLVAAGWHRPRIFAEASSEIPAEFAHLPVTWRHPTVGCWPNYYLALHELLVREADCDAYMLAQDDVVFCEGDEEENLREFLESALWPSDETGVVSLYTSSAYATPERGWHRLQRKWVWGACALVFPRASLIHFLSHNAIRWRLEGKNAGMRNIDTVVGQWQVEHGKSVWFPSPSLAQHIGETSTIWQRARATGKRRARDFAGDMVAPPATGCGPCEKGSHFSRGQDASTG